MALHRANGALGIRNRLTLGDLTDQHFARLRESDHRRGGTTTFGVGDDDRLAGLQHGDHRVGGSQVDADCLCHENLLDSLSFSPAHPESQNSLQPLYRVESLLVKKIHRSYITFRKPHENKAIELQHRPN